ncbi:MAG: DUF4373 domain-containing protein [Tractidigestivibacter sp.]|uniref:Lin1244/Lin1753 domain-containing protein n=1 Tax=Tractidigestivibacter sp. TaxID=2847320 RepID=UPI002A8126FB|nr:Lin1244/Lin1753 domain-containing protein [Tractidigestivibacter sp.]MDY4534165.1 DUF4373 domain-containing protein [Tractidigestivibacter sp.]
MDSLDNPEVQDASMAPMLFFPHDADSASDVKCRRLILRLGYEGYGRWWRLCELMASATGHAVPCATEEDRMLLCDELRCDEDGLSALLDALADLGLVPGDVLAEGHIASERMTKNALYFGRRKVNGRKGGVRQGGA